MFTKISEKLLSERKEYKERNNIDINECINRQKDLQFNINKYFGKMSSTMNEITKFVAESLREDKLKAILNKSINPVFLQIVHEFISLLSITDFNEYLIDITGNNEILEYYKKDKLDIVIDIPDNESKIHIYSDLSFEKVNIVYLLKDKEEKYLLVNNDKIFTFCNDILNKDKVAKINLTINPKIVDFTKFSVMFCKGFKESFVKLGIKSDDISELTSKYGEENKQYLDIAILIEKRLENINNLLFKHYILEKI